MRFNQLLGALLLYRRKFGGDQQDMREQLSTAFPMHEVSGGGCGPMKPNSASALHWAHMPCAKL